MEINKLWLGGMPAEWDFASWPVRTLLEKWGAKAHQVVLTLAEDTIATLTFGQKIALRSLLERSRAELSSTPSLPKAGGAVVLSRVRSVAGEVSWATAEAMACVPDVSWGDGQGAPIVVGRETVSSIGMGRRLDPMLLFRTDTERADLIQIADQVNGPADGFGQRFWAFILEHKPEIGQLLKSGEKLSEVVYQDRYLFSPLPVRLLCEVLKPIAAMGSASGVDVLLRTRARRAAGYSSVPFQVRDDWLHTQHRDGVVEEALARLLLRARIETGQNRDLPHERTLLLRWDNGGMLKIHLDQGFGYWDTVRETSFPFTSNPAAQSQALLSMRFDVQSRTNHKMPVFVLDIVLPGENRSSL